ncbi:MAG: lysine-sensitive aspartokinase 3 [Bacteroidota bacterium]
MIVMKFGGTSVEDAAAMHRVAAIIRRELPRKPFVVLSACSGVTDELLAIAGNILQTGEDQSLALLDRLSDRHKLIAKKLLSPECLDGVLHGLDGMFQELRNYIHGISLLGELTNRSLDTFTSYGERCSTYIFHAALQENGLPTALIPAAEFMITDDAFMNAQPQMNIISKKVQEIIPKYSTSHDVLLTQGFIGSTKEGTTTTLGRGGSDYSAAILGAVIGVEEIQIWTDVDGMMTADPRIVSNPKRIETMSFDEAAELAYFGAKVLHPNTIYPAVQKGIPVRVLNSRNPQSSGTLILAANSPDQKFTDVVKSIAFKRGITVINISSSRMLMAHGFLAKLFSIFAEHRKSIDVVATSEVSVSVTIDNEEGLSEILRELEQIGEVRIARDKAIICIVGEGMKQTPGVGARIFSALGTATINIEMVSEGASEINLTLVVSHEQVVEAVRVLHAEFFDKQEGACN